MKPATKKLHIRTLGCPKNEADSEHLRGVLEAAGYAWASDPAEADVVVVNTCSFIEAARRESVDAVLEEVTHRTPGQRVIVSGCLVERYGSELATELPEVDGFMSLGAYGRATEVVDRVVAGTRQLCFDPGKVPDGFDARSAPEGSTAYVKISEGCDRTCTFCAIPLIRGRHRSRAPQAIAAEVRTLVRGGVKEVVLVAQDMSLYGRDSAGRWMLPDLLRKLGDTEGLLWLRMLYQYPRYVDRELLDAVAEAPAAVPYFDLSLQHAAGHLVRRMKRWGDGERFLELIAKARERLGEVALRSAFIVGFPGETEADVDLLADFLREAQLDWAGFFPFSPEEGTEAGTFSEGVVDAEVAAHRAEVLAEIQSEVAEAKRRCLVGAEVEVLVEDRRGTELVGRTWREAPEVDATVSVDGVQGGARRVIGARTPGLDGLRATRVGDVVRARVESVDGLDLRARAV